LKRASPCRFIAVAPGQRSQEPVGFAAHDTGRAAAGEIPPVVCAVPAQISLRRDGAKYLRDPCASSDGASAFEHLHLEDPGQAPIFVHIPTRKAGDVRNGPVPRPASLLVALANQHAPVVLPALPFLQLLARFSREKRANAGHKTGVPKAILQLSPSKYSLKT